MDMISNTTSNTTAQSDVHNKQEEAMVASPPREEAAAAARNTNANQAQQQQVVASSGGERKPRPQQEYGLNCPRCNSTNTKFCYYNNNSLTQPRYLCKTCRRNWTQGGILRNVPVGGSSRKNKLHRTGGSSSSAPPAPSSSSNDSVKKMNLTQQLSMMPTATTPMPTNFPNVLTTFMSTSGGFELPSSDHDSLDFPPLSPLFNPGTEPWLHDMLTGGFHDSGSNGMAAPPLLGTMQHGHGMMGGGSSDQQLVGFLQGGVDQALQQPPMAAAGGSGLQQWPSLPAQDQQVFGGDGSTADNNNTTTNGDGASSGSNGVEHYWQGSI